LWFGNTKFLNKSEFSLAVEIRFFRNRIKKNASVSESIF